MDTAAIPHGASPPEAKRNPAMSNPDELAELRRLLLSLVGLVLLGAVHHVKGGRLLLVDELLLSALFAVHTMVHTERGETEECAQEM